MVKSFSVFSVVETTPALKERANFSSLSALGGYEMNVSLMEFKNIIAQLDPKSLEDVLNRARVVVQNPKATRCEACKQIPMFAWRGGRRFCCNACKQKAYRQRKEFAGGVA